MTILRQTMTEDLRLRNYAPSTIEKYVAQFARFAPHFCKSPHLLGREEIRRWQVHLREQRDASWAVFNQTVCALRFLCGVTLKKDQERMNSP